VSEGSIDSNAINDIVYIITADADLILASINIFFTDSTFGITANKAMVMQNTDTKTNTLSRTSASTDFPPLIVENVRKDVI
jgi:hypothetical protein